MRKKTFGYHLKDARSINEVIKNELVDVTITSPPYSEMKDYGSKEQIGFGQKYREQYMPDLEKVFSQCYEITKSTGSLWIIMDTFRSNGGVKLLPFDIANVLEKIGWLLKDIIVWEKDKALPWTGKGQLRNIFEYILFFVKSENYKYYIDRIKEIGFKQWWIKYPERYNPKGKVPTNVWKISIPIQGSWSNSNLRHFCPFPLELVEKILMLTTDERDVVLDPFAGSGVVLAQATCMNRKSIGFDIRKDYKYMYEEFITKEVKERWGIRKKELESLETKRNIIKNEIIKLRQLKYPKLLIKELNKSSINKEVSSSIITVIAVSAPFIPDENTKKHQFINENIYIITRNDLLNNEISDEIYKATSKPPLSKFGIIPKFEILSFNTFKETKIEYFNFSCSNLWLYSGGTVHKYSKPISFQEILDVIADCKEKYLGEIPPIISNIKVFFNISSTNAKQGVLF